MSEASWKKVEETRAYWRRRRGRPEGEEPLGDDAPEMTPETEKALGEEWTRLSERGEPTEDVAPFLQGHENTVLIHVAFEVIGLSGERIAEDYVKVSPHSLKEDVESLALSFARRDYGEDVSVRLVRAVDLSYVLGLMGRLKRG
jgi:hypothetical protein